MKLYKTKLRPTIRERYNKQLSAIRKGDKPPDRLSVAIETAVEFLETESEKVKAEVEQFQLNGDLDEGLDDKEKARCR